MGISIPIGAEHYDKLKRISDKLGLGLKKTIEYLVLHYWQKEIERSVVESKESKPSPVESRRVKSTDVPSRPVYYTISTKISHSSTTRYSTILFRLRFGKKTKCKILS